VLVLSEAVLVIVTTSAVIARSEATKQSRLFIMTKCNQGGEDEGEGGPSPQKGEGGKLDCGSYMLCSYNF
jgi:hypothetical protein